METGAHGVLGLGILAEAGEDAGGGTVHGIGADGLHLAAPDGAGHGHVDQGAGVGVEIHLVEKNVAAFPRESRWCAGQGDDPTASERKGGDEGGDVLLGVEDLDDFAGEAGGDHVGEFAPAGDVVGNELLGGEQVAGRDPLGEVAPAHALLEAAVGGGVGGADAAALLVEFEGRVVGDPLVLVRQEVGGGGQRSEVRGQRSESRGQNGRSGRVLTSDF